MSWRVKKKAGKVKRITLAELFDAIEANGLPQTRGGYWTFTNKTYGGDNTFGIGSACAIGQAALNLGIDYSDLEYAFENFKNTKGTKLTDAIINKNDALHWNYKAIANWGRKSYAEQLGDTVNVNEIYSVEKD